MTAGGYAAKRSRPSVATMAAVVGVHAAAITALMLARTEFIPRIEGILIAENVRLPDDPPPPEIKRAADKPRPNQRATAPDRAIETSIDDTIVLTPLDPIEPTLPDAGPDIGATVTTLPDPPAPVLRRAEVDARYAAAFQPPYPPAMQRQGQEGAVVIRVLVARDGRVLRAEIVSAADEAFAAATLRQALQRWRFTPATRDGEPIEGWRTMTVRFEMRG